MRKRDMKTITTQKKEGGHREINEVALAGPRNAGSTPGYEELHPAVSIFLEQEFAQAICTAISAG
jgi:hypothetical protein